ncbi:MAG: glyoxalase/bleomycin resistance/dioxygenase family protein [Methanimicrococcus sp.]|nr:glyoxalase/bleomycin resistance/dioxygenase family protein [Methanimicrococcus sp.]
MKYSGTLIAVSDVAKSKDFYVNVMEEKVIMDLGVYVAFESGLCMHSDYEGLVGVKLEARARPDNFELYFETEDLAAWETKLKSVEGLEFLHESKEYPWGQSVLRFYDHDKYIVEVAETMEGVAKRFMAQGLSVEETAQRMMSPIEFVKQFV